MEGAMKYRALFRIIYFIHFVHCVVLIDDEKIVTFLGQDQSLSSGKKHPVKWAGHDNNSLA